MVQNLLSSTAGAAFSINPGIGRLSGAELEVARLIANGLRNKEIARVLHRSEKTVERHVSQIFLKLEIDQSHGQFDRRVLTCRAVLASELAPAIVALASAVTLNPFG